jgi:predicted NodU family carbamoyl transferase
VNRPEIAFNVSRTQDGRPQVDGAVAVMMDENIFSLPAELVTRRKHDGNIWQTLNYACQTLAIRLDEVGHFHVSTCGEPVPLPGSPVYVRSDGRLSLQDLDVGAGQIHWCRSHHENHAWEAIFASHNQGCLALPLLVYVADRIGQPGEHQSLYLYAGGSDLRLIARDRVRSGYVAGIGECFDRVTRYLGWRENFDVGKTMALAGLCDAPAPKKRYFFDLADGSLVALLPSAEAAAIRVFRRWCGPSLDAHSRLSAGAALAAQLQYEAEEVVLDFLRSKIVGRKPKAILFGGGMATNCKILGRVAVGIGDMPVMGSLVPGDTGQGIGSLVAAFIRKHQRLPRTQPKGGFWMNRTGIHVSVGLDGSVMIPGTNRPFCIVGAEDADPQLAARSILNGGLVAICTDTIEPGPRALGFHSLLADARDATIPDFINQTIKGRDRFQPFGGLICHDFARQTFGRGYISPYMDLALPAPDLFCSLYPAVVHKDGTVRLQTIGLTHKNSFIGSLFHFLSLKSDVRVLLNTSLNGHEMPLILEPAAVYSSLFDGSMECKTQ